MRTARSHRRPGVPHLPTDPTKNLTDTLGRGIFPRKQVRGGGSDTACSLDSGCHSSRLAATWSRLGHTAPFYPHCSQQRSGETKARCSRGLPGDTFGLEVGCGKAQPSRSCLPEIPRKQRWGSGQLGLSPGHSCVVYARRCLSLCLSLPFWKRNKRVDREDVYESFYLELPRIRDSCEPSCTERDSPFRGRHSRRREEGGGLSPHAAFSRVWPPQSPGDPDPASLPSGSLLLSTALSFFPLRGSSPVVARLAAAARLWLHPPPGFARLQLSRLPGAAAAGRQRGRPRPRQRGAARGGPAGGREAELGPGPFGALPPPGLIRARKDRGGLALQLGTLPGVLGSHAPH